MAAKPAARGGVIVLATIAAAVRVAAAQPSPPLATPQGLPAQSELTEVTIPGAGAFEVHTQLQRSWYGQATCSGDPNQVREAHFIALGAREEGGEEICLRLDNSTYVRALYTCHGHNVISNLTLCDSTWCQGDCPFDYGYSNFTAEAYVLLREGKCATFLYEFFGTTLVSDIQSGGAHLPDVCAQELAPSPDPLAMTKHSVYWALLALLAVPLLAGGLLWRRRLHYAASFPADTWHGSTELSKQMAWINSESLLGKIARRITAHVAAIPIRNIAEPEPVDDSSKSKQHSCLSIPNTTDDLRAFVFENQAMRIGDGGEANIYLALVEDGSAQPQCSSFMTPRSHTHIGLGAFKRFHRPWAGEGMKRILRSNACRNSLNVIGVPSVVGSVTTSKGCYECNGLLSPFCRLGDLKKAMKEKRLALSIARIETIVIGLANYLGDLHESSMLHRDIKPGNILLECECDSDGSMTHRIMQWACKLAQKEIDATERDGRKFVTKSFGSWLSRERPAGGDGADDALEPLAMPRCTCLEDHSKPLNVQVCDIGLSRELSMGETYSSGNLAGTIGYLAPERVSHAIGKMKDRPGSPSAQSLGSSDSDGSCAIEDVRLQGAKDVWAIGVVAWELLQYFQTDEYVSMFDATLKETMAEACADAEAVSTDFIAPSLTRLSKQAPKLPNTNGTSHLKAVTYAALQGDPLMRPTARELSAMLSVRGGIMHRS